MEPIQPIPVYPASRELVLEDKPWFDRHFHLLQPLISEMTFAGLFLFRRAHSYRLTSLQGIPFILGQGYDSTRYFLPPLSTATPSFFNVLLDEGLHFYGADTRFVESCLTGTTFTLKPDRDNNDYLYSRESLATLPGNRYHKKKNRINYFLSRHNAAVEFYASSHRQGCLSLLAEWQEARSGDAGASAAEEAFSAEEALLLAEPLGLSGLVVLVNGIVKAFALGERLNSTTAVCHFEKGDPFMEGVTQFVNREFARLLFTDCPYLNREQDLGEPGLRAAKLSYHPEMLIEKYRVYRG